MTTHPLCDITVLDQFRTVPIPPGYPTDRRTFYSPRDNSHACLNFVLGSAQSSIALSMYGFTDPTLLATLVGLVKAGLTTLVVLDSSQLTGPTEKANVAPLLALRATCPNLRLSVGTSEDDAIMHHKSGVIDGTVIFTGSTNWSDSGEEKQDNQLTCAISPAESADLIARIEAIYAYQIAHCAQPS